MMSAYHTSTFTECTLTEMITWLYISGKFSSTVLNMFYSMCPYLDMLENLLCTPAAQLFVLLNHFLSSAFRELLHQTQQHHGNCHAISGNVSRKLGPAQSWRVLPHPVDELFHHLFSLQLMTQWEIYYWSPEGGIQNWHNSTLRKWSKNNIKYKTISTIQ